MINYKDVVSKGILHLKSGIYEYQNWSKKLLEDFGYVIQPQLRYIRKWSIVLKGSLKGKNFNRKLNCWQFMGCKYAGCLSNEFDNNFVLESCPVILGKEYNGLDNGRRCWLVLNTRCFGYIQKDYKQKLETCNNCDFYKLVIEEEDINTDLYSELHELNFFK